MNKSGIEIIVDAIIADTPTHKLLSLSNIFEDGSWKQQNIERFIGNHVHEAALSARERNALIDEPYSLTEESKSKLRHSSSDSKAEGSELAEICLYGIMKRHYNALPIVPKIFYKQNSRDYAKGADSVHLTIEDNDFSIWMGESKFYSDLNKAFNEALSSVSELLATNKLKKENSILANLNELNELQQENPKLTDEVKEKIISFLGDSQRCIDKFKPKLHVPIFIMHECGITKSATELTDEYKGKLEDKHSQDAIKFFVKKIETLNGINKIDCIHFHLILLPIPNKSALTDWYQKSFLGVRNVT
ncbi:MAG: HamA C-terminal domain-containing protein [Formosimonas sp.]